MKKTKLVATILTICLAISTLAYGVYAATNLSFGITANVAFEVKNLFFEMELILSAYDSSGEPDVNTHTYNWGASYSPTLVADTTALNNWATANVNDFTGLYFNSGNVASAITIEVTIKNRTPSKDIVLTIADDNAGENESKYTNVNSVTNAVKGIAKQTGETPNQATASISYTPKTLSTGFTFAPNWTISINEGRVISLHVEEYSQTYEGYTTTYFTTNNQEINVPETITYTGGTISLPNLQKVTYANESNGYINNTFLGWFENADYSGTAIANIAEYTPGANITNLYAKFANNGWGFSGGTGK